MTLTEFRSLIRLYVPSAKVARVPNANLDILINKGVVEVNIAVAAYKAEKTFNVTAEKGVYTISTDLPDFVTPSESGLWWNGGTASSPNWLKLDPYTRQSLDDQFPLWRDENSKDPQRYFIEADLLTIHPKPNVTLSDGFWMYHVRSVNPMTLGTHYPFSGSTIELKPYQVLDDSIIDYVRWKLAGPLKGDQVGIITQQDYKANLAERAELFRMRLDMTASPYNRMKGPQIGP